MDRPPPVVSRAGMPFTPASLTLEELRGDMAQFVTEREWGAFHTPRNLLLALLAEAGELAETLQWKGEVAPGLPSLTEAERVHVGEELSDVLLYTVRLSDVCGLDLAACVLRKLELNRAKYPAEKCRGSAAKYTVYAAGGGGRDGAATGSAAISGDGGSRRMEWWVPAGALLAALAGFAAARAWR